MAEHEFTAQQNKIFAQLSRHLRQVGILLVILALLRVLIVMKSWAVHGLTTDLIAYILSGVVQFGIGIILWRPSIYFSRVVATQGRDITELMVGLEELSRGMMAVIYLVLAVIVFIIIRVIAP